MPNDIQLEVSVIIPVYNAEFFLRKAVESAVHLDEVREVILVEDASPDNALQLAKSLEREFDKVKVIQHPDKKNHGAGASRNLGITNAKFEYIAFLDADDYYLQNRFTTDKILFNNPDCDGVYNAVGTHFYSEEAKKQFFDKGFGYQETLTINGKPKPNELFDVLFHQHQKFEGQFHTNGITIKKSVFKKIGDFNTELRLQQDIHLWRRMAAFCNLHAGAIDKPVAMRGIHASNRMTNVTDHDQYRILWWKSLKSEFKSKKLQNEKYKIFERAYLNFFIRTSNRLTSFIYFVTFCVKYPNTISKSYESFDLNFWRVFGKNWFTLRLISMKNKIFKKNHMLTL